MHALRLSLVSALATQVTIYNSSLMSIASYTYIATLITTTAILIVAMHQAATCLREGISY